MKSLLHSRIFFLIAAFALLYASPATAQRAYTLVLDPGTRVRITTAQEPRHKVVGEVRSVTRDTLFLDVSRDDPKSTYPVAELHSLETRGGTNRVLGMLIGAGIGGAIGFSEGPDQRGSVTFGTALLGALVGFAFAPKGWETIPLPAR